MNSQDGSFDVLLFAQYVRARWRFVVVCSTVAVMLAAAVSITLPKRYTATASILIGTPAGLDPRAATSVSPVYLESLRTFERVALSDSLFLQALDHLGIPHDGRSIEGLKRSVLEVSKPVNTRIIEIRATLEDPRKAKELVQYIAEQTVTLVRGLDTRLADDLAKEATTIFDNAARRIQNAKQAAAETTRGPGVEIMAAELENLRELKLKVDEDLAKTRAELADYSAQSASGQSPSDWIPRQVAALRARAGELETQVAKLQQTIASSGARFERLKQRQDGLDTELLASRTEYESARSKLAEIKSSSAFHGERLDVFDPGIIPQRPSYPNIPLNIFVALVISALASLTVLAIRFGYDQLVLRRVEREYSHIR